MSLESGKPVDDHFARFMVLSTSRTGNNNFPVSPAAISGLM
jgi:hypothetical protein